MARERYLVGVDLDELKKGETPTPPQTPRGKWENFWYYHKWKVVTGVAIAAILVILFGQSLSRKDPDYMICMVTTQPVSMEAEKRLEELLTECAGDRNGDGKTYVEIQLLNVAPVTNNIPNSDATANQQAVIAHIMARDIDLWAVSPSYYTDTFGAAFDGDPASFFIPLDDMAQTVSGVSEDHAYWNWKDIEILKKDEKLSTMQKELYWGVRVLPEDPSDEEKKAAADTLAFLKSFAESQQK